MKGKVVLITGAGSGIGRHMAIRFAQAGAGVAIVDLDWPAARLLAGQLAEDGYNAASFRADVRLEEDVETCVNDVVERFGTIDTAICNAGIQRISPFEDFSLEAWRQVIGVHVDGSFLTARAMFRRLRAQNKAGSIIVIGSIHSHLAAPFKSAYVTAKHGLAGLVRSIAREGGAHNIRAYLLCPGFVDTPLVRAQIPDLSRQLNLSEDEVIRSVMLGGTVDGQFTTVDELADVALFLANFPSNALTGQTFVVSHGADMH